jgi:thiamine pyrophosphate-dependent acetolactate synthase large subunit-like protein
MAKVADRIVETLEAANVRRIFGLVGDSLNGITESLRVREKIQWIAVRHEEVAAFCRRRARAADGRSRCMHRKLWPRQFAPDQWAL